MIIIAKLSLEPSSITQGQGSNHNRKYVYGTPTIWLDLPLLQTECMHTTGGGGRDVYTLTTNPLGTHKTPNQTTKTYTSPVIQGQGPNRHHIIENRSIGHLDSIYVIGLQHGIYTPKLRHRHQRIPNLEQRSYLHTTNAFSE